MKLRLTGDLYGRDNCINSVIRRYHFDSDKKDILEKMYCEIRKIISPFAIYRINQWITSVKKIDENQVALVAISLGKEIDVLYDDYISKGKLEEAYMVECISNEILMGLYEEFNKIYSELHRRYISGYVFIGDEVPLTKIRELLVKLQEKNIESLDIKANECGVMQPTKTVLFYAILSDNPMDSCKGICDCCLNKNCDYRGKDKYYG